MGEPVLRLVVPAEPDDRDVAGWPASPPAGSGPAWPATNPAAGATTGASPGATAPAASGATTGATIPGPAPAGSAAAPPWRQPADSAAAGSPAAGGQAEGGEPALEPYGRQMTWGERVWRLIAHWWELHRADAGRPGGFWHGAWTGRPDSLAQVHAYAVGRAWVPDGHEGSLIPGIGAAYSHTIAKGGTALGLFIAWVTQRMLRFALFLLVTGTVAGLIIWFS